MPAESKIFPEHSNDKSGDELREGFETIDPRFDKLLPENPKIAHHWRGAEWAEGAVYLPRQKLVVMSDVPNNRMINYNPATGETAVHREPSNFSNGNTTDHEGRMVTAEHQTNRITRTEHDGSVTTLVDNFEGKRFNSPNDLVVKSDGTIWFTDPPYGILSNREGTKRDSDYGANYVFRYNPESSSLSVAIDTMDRPNGLAFSPDESILYVADTGEPRNVLAFDVADDGKTLSNEREFLLVRPGASDGFRCDVNGNIWTSAEDGVHSYTPRGELIGKILLPEQSTANCCFGGPEYTTLYIASDTSLYSVELAIAGAMYGK